ncbi:MAG TPA: hypothetical protein VMY59_01030 [Candidatus Thermoplasmatota archaeon]|nr:hypothetical protein [Candidatus Thermoplasmatota archaeon]
MNRIYLNRNRKNNIKRELKNKLSKITIEELTQEIEQVAFEVAQLKKDGGKNGI